MRFSLLLPTCALALATPAAADITVKFEESAPRDRFIIQNEDTCETGPAKIEIDLTGSAGRLIFDTTASGAGVEVFQPFRLVTGADKVLSVTPVGDGDERVAFELSTLAPGEIVAFTVDVDDRLTDSSLGQIRVSGTEIVGATASAQFGNEMRNASFDEGAQATIEYAACSS